MKVHKISKKIVLVGIVILASLLRLYHLGTNPPHLTSDEAALGYNAYSILKTGRDEHGEVLPLIFKSFGDYKPGFYIYSVVPSVAILGLNEFSVRLPSAIAGVVAVVLIYLIFGSLFSNRYALIVAFLLALSPWHIYFSRGAWEVNLALTLTLAGIYFYLKSLKKHYYLVLSALFFASTLLAYQGAKLSTTIVVVLLLLLWGKQLIKLPKGVLIQSLIVGFLIVIPILFGFFEGKTGRLNVFSVFSYPRPQQYLQDFLDEGGERVGSISYYLFHSELLNFLRGVMGRYFNHFSTRFLFFEGDWQNPRHSPPNHGMLLVADIMLLLAGLVFWAKNIKKKEYLFVFLWLITACLPSALSRDQVHAVRAFNMVIPLIFVLSFGVIYLIENIKKARLLIFSLLATGYLFSYLYFVDTYFIHLPKHNSSYWQYGYKQVVEEVSRINNKYSKIVVGQSYAQPYIYFLFFNGHLRDSILNRTNNAGVDVGLVNSLGNITFSEIDLWAQKVSKGNLLVLPGNTISKDLIQNDTKLNLINEIKYLNNLDTAFFIVETK